MTAATDRPATQAIEIQLETPPQPDNVMLRLWRRSRWLSHMATILISLLLVVRLSEPGLLAANLLNGGNMQALFEHPQHAAAAK